LKVNVQREKEAALLKAQMEAKAAKVQAYSQVHVVKSSQLKTKVNMDVEAYAPHKMSENKNKHKHSKICENNQNGIRIKNRKI
jgi:hypothetical protein